MTDGVWAAVSRRRMIRRFADRPLEPDHLDRIIAAGRRAASSKNSQPWSFVVCREREHLQALAKVGPWAGHLAGAAVGIALVSMDPAIAEAPLSVMFDLGQATDAMMLTAWELGVGSVIATVYDQPLVKQLLDLPADRHCEFMLSFGYPADPTDLTRPLKPGGRRPLAEIVHEERW